MDLNSNSVDIQLAQSRFMTKVYGWMTLALLVTGMVAMYTASSYQLLSLIFSSNITFYGIIIGEIALVMFLSRAITKMPTGMAIGGFMLYSVLNGLTMSVIFLVYTSSSISSTFVITSLTFGVMTVYGYVTKKDLTNTGSLLIMGLFGVIIASIANIFMNSETLYWIISYAGVFIFIGLTAYDTQKLKNYYAMGAYHSEDGMKLSIKGALILYLDFINLFFFLLRLLGRRK